MKLPVQITFRDMSPSEALEANVREKAQNLNRFYDGIMGCRVVVEARHKHHHKGNLYHLRIELTVPGQEVVVSREPVEDHSHEDVYVAIRDAFDAARRQLEDYARRHRHQVKKHAQAPESTPPGAE
jgi:ribosomal subunit interface protein